MPIETIGRVNKAGKLEIDLPEALPPGTVLQLSVEIVDPDPAWFWASPGQEGKPKIENVATTDDTNAMADGGLLEEVDSIDEP